MNTPKMRSHYAAALFGGDKYRIDLGPVDISDAADDDIAKEIGRKRAVEWLFQSGYDNATLQITSDGQGLPPIEIHLLSYSNV